MANMHLVTGHAGAAHVTAADHGSFNAAIFGGGEYVLNRGNKLAATVVSNNLISIADGDILMQGRHIRLDERTTVDLTIENGAQDMLRNDLIVARYTKDTSTDVEECNLMVIKGTAVASDPADPDYNSGDLINDHVLILDMPLYRVPLNGINVQTPVPLFEEAEGFVPTSVTGSGTINMTVEDNREYSYTGVTSLTMVAANVECHGFVTFGASTPSINVSGFAGSSGDDITSATAGQTWEFSCFKGYIIWKNWSA